MLGGNRGSWDGTFCQRCSFWIMRIFKKLTMFYAFCLHPTQNWQYHRVEHIKLRRYESFGHGGAMVMSSVWWWWWSMSMVTPLLPYHQTQVTPHSKALSMGYPAVMMMVDGIEAVGQRIFFFFIVSCNACDGDAAFFCFFGKGGSPPHWMHHFHTFPCNANDTIVQNASE